MEPTQNPTPAASGIKIIGLVGVVVVVGAVTAFLMRSPTGSPAENTSESGVRVSIQGDFRGSMRDLAALGQSTRCTFSYSAPNSASTGEVFVAEGKVRGNFSVDVTSPVQSSFKAFMIADGDMSWVWTDAVPQGFRVPIMPDNGSAPQGEGIDYNQDLDYSCAPWEKDLSFFIPPADIAFVDAPVPVQ